MPRTTASSALSADRLHFWAAAAFLALVFLTGGGARADIASLILLRPIAGAYLAYGLWRTNGVQLRPHRFTIGLLAATAFIGAIQLIPLPPALWQSLPSHSIVAEIDRAVGLHGVWRPLSLGPAETSNAVLALLPPAALLVNLAALDRRDQIAFLYVLLALLGLSGLLGVAQVLGGRGSGLYLYRVTNEGFAVGLFSNRNHQAIALACGFPLLAFLALGEPVARNSGRGRTIVALAGAAALVPLILVTGSRTGLVTGIIGLVAAILIYRRQFSAGSSRMASDGWSRWVAWMVGAAAIALAALTAYFSRAEVFDRFNEGNTLESVRFKVWRPIFEIAIDFMPFGSGLGTFSDVYKIYEPTALLRPTFLNHAHNDWLEVLLIAGLPGVALLLAALVGYGRLMFLATFTQRRGAEAVAALAGTAILAVIAVASIADYPLRTPSIACIFMVATVWLTGLSASAGKLLGNNGLSAGVSRRGSAERTSL